MTQNPKFPFYQHLATSICENYPIRHQQASFTLHQMVMSSKQMLHDFLFFFHGSRISSLHSHVLQQIPPQILFGSDNMSQELKPEMFQLWQQSAALIICWSEDMHSVAVNETVTGASSKSFLLRFPRNAGIIFFFEIVLLQPCPWLFNKDDRSANYIWLHVLFILQVS